MLCSTRIFILLGLTSTVFAWPQENKLQNDRGVRVQVGPVLAEIAKELIQRSSTNSQVLSLNLSSLLLLMVLKAIVLGAGYMGPHGYKGRELGEGSMISESEVALGLGYLVGEGCLYRAACEVPYKAEEYLDAADMLLQSIKLMPWSAEMDHQKYEKMILELRKAVDYGFTKQCPPQYTCKKENINNFLKDASATGI